MLRLSYLLLTFFIGLSTFFFTENLDTYAVKTPAQQHHVVKNTAFNNQGIIVNSNLDFSSNTSLEDNIPFFKYLHLKNAVYKEQQENYLSYQKTCKLINIRLTTKAIIFPFHSFT